MKKESKNVGPKMEARYQPVSIINDPRYFICIAKGSGYNFIVHAIPKVKLRIKGNVNEGDLMWMVTSEDLIDLLLELTDTHVYEVHRLDVMTEDDWNYLNTNYPFGPPKDDNESDWNEDNNLAA